MSEVETGVHYPIKLEDLPKSWSAGYVGDFAETVQPGFASGKHNKGGAGIPHLRPMNVDKDGKISMEEVKFVASDKDKKRLRAGDVLFNNTNSPVWVGKTAYVAQADDVAFSNHMTRVVFNDEVSPKFGALQLHYLWMTGYFLHRCTKHVNQASISSKTLADTVPFIVPESRDTQDQIVAEIEKQFSRLDEAVDSLTRVKANLKRYKAAVLKAAVEGKLTEEWRKQNPDVEPASKLIERILAERRTKWEEAELGKMKAKGKEPKNDKWKEKIRANELSPASLYDLPDGWEWTRIGEVADMMSGHAFKKAEYTKQGVRLFQIANVSFGSTKWDEIEYLPEEYLQTWRKLSLNEGDVVMALNRPLLSSTLKISRLSAADVPSILYQRVGRFLFYRQELSEFFLLYMQSPVYVRQLEGQLQGVNIPFINKSKLLETPFPLPSCLEELKEITDSADSKLSFVAQLQSGVEKALSRIKMLRQSVLENAFSGALESLGETQVGGSTLSKVG